MADGYKNTAEGMIKRADIIGKMQGFAANSNDAELGKLFAMVYETTLASQDATEREFTSIALRDIAAEMTRRGIMAK